MCTLILGVNVVAPRTVLVAANRDEDPARPSDPPGMLIDDPPIAGGRDRLAGGTWLAVRERLAVVAVLNRSESPPPPTGEAPMVRRSRGLMVLDVASTPFQEPSMPLLRASLLAHEMMENASRLIQDAAYSPLSIVISTGDITYALADDGKGELRGGVTVSPLPGPRRGILNDLFVNRGWHVITHRDVDDRTEPRTARVLDELADAKPSTADEAIEQAARLLRLHGDGGPPICLHERRMVTVSSSIVWLAPDEARYLHAEGRPCEAPFRDYSHLLRGRASPSGSR